MKNTDINHSKFFWDDLDFFINKALWAHRGYDKAIEIRKKNLKDVRCIFYNHKLIFFLEGRTLQNVFLKFGRKFILKYFL